MSKGERATGRDMLGTGDSLAVERFRARLLKRLGIPRAPRGGRVLDIGCGDGLEALGFLRQGWRVDAFDIEPHPRWPELAKAWKGRLRFRVGGVAELERLKGSWDRVFQKDVLHHVPEPERLLRAMARLVKPGGVVDVVECNRLNPVFYVHLTLLGGHQHFTRRRLMALAEAAGLKGARLSLLEARVWPWDNPAFQDAMEAAQNAVERAGIFGPWLCYHLVRWEKPAKKGRPKP